MGSRRRAKACGLQTARTAQGSRASRNALPLRGGDSGVAPPAREEQSPHPGDGLPAGPPEGSTGTSLGPRRTGGPRTPTAHRGLTRAWRREAALQVWARAVGPRSGSPIEQGHPSDNARTHSPRRSPRRQAWGSDWAWMPGVSSCLQTAAGRRVRVSQGAAPLQKKQKTRNELPAALAAVQRQSGAPPQARRRRAGPRLERWVHRQAKRTC